METGAGPTLQSLLCLAWLAATFPIVAAALPIPEAAGGRLLHCLLAAFSSRGKTARSSSSSSSSNTKFTVPQKFFLHFYVVGVTVTTVLLLAIWFYAYMKMTPLSTEPSSYSAIASHILGGSNSFSLSNFLSRPKEHKYRVWRTVFVLLLMEVQVLRRLYETEHVFHYSPSARMHIVGYLTGIL
ncbi:hypothetical protein EJB05_54905 [Eragrostis curvula]|uniref:Uncharacterized protein n=1 Tax=Eragrostis curvula TaxID=38414 RepID=A0A5J9SL64_9POAL|nr:hypothetical protein EJB05_54905 [Eragrostis curvula]